MRRGGAERNKKAAASGLLVVAGPALIKARRVMAHTYTQTERETHLCCCR